MTRSDFFENNENYIKKLVLDYYIRYHYFGIEYNDLYQTAVLEVLSRFDDYDSSRGAVTTFITFVVRSALIKYVNENLAITHIPYELIENSKKLFMKQEQFFLENGREMTYEEMIKFIDDYTKNSANTKYVNKLLNINEYYLRGKVLDIDEELCTEDEIVEDIIALRDTIPSGENIEEEVVSKLIAIGVLRYLYKIEPINYDLFIENIGIIDGNEKKIRDIAEERNTSFQNIQQKLKRFYELIEARKGTIKKLIK